METEKASRTALFMAAYRARATEEAGAIMSDPWARALAGEEGFELARRYDAVFPHMVLWTAVRVASIDRCVRRALGPLGVDQIVLLGAGLDTRAARLAEAGGRARFFEVDHPSTQREKLARVGALAGYPKEAATYVACDFESEDFFDALERAGLDRGRAALFVWEGVTPYLTEAAVRGTLRRVAEAAHPSSSIVFDHLRKKIVQGDVEQADLQSRDFVGDLGEPLRWGTDDVLPVLYAEGFRRVRSRSFDELCLELTGTYDRERKFRFQSIAVASRGAGELP